MAVPEEAGGCEMFGEPMGREAAAKLIGISLQGLDVHIRKGTFRSVKLGKRRIFYSNWLREDLMRLVEGGKRQPTGYIDDLVDDLESLMG
jgi:hypothetical protein